MGCLCQPDPPTLTVTASLVHALSTASKTKATPTPTTDPVLSFMASTMTTTFWPRLQWFPAPPSVSFSLPALPIEKTELKNRDVQRTISQRKSKLRRQVFVRSNTVLGYPEDFLFETIYPIYGPPDSPIHGYKTYSRHHIQKLTMLPSVYDPGFRYMTRCLSCSARSSNRPRGMMCLQTDDTLYAYNKTYSEREECMSKSFDP